MRFSKMAAAAILKFTLTAITRSLLHIFAQNLAQRLKTTSRRQMDIKMAAIRPATATIQCSLGNSTVTCHHDPARLTAQPATVGTNGVLWLNIVYYRVIWRQSVVYADYAKMISSRKSQLQMVNGRLKHMFFKIQDGRQDGCHGHINLQFFITFVLTSKYSIMALLVLIIMYLTSRDLIIALIYYLGVIFMEKQAVAARWAATAWFSGLIACGSCMQPTLLGQWPTLVNRQGPINHACYVTVASALLQPSSQPANFYCRWSHWPTWGHRAAFLEICHYQAGLHMSWTWSSRVCVPKFAVVRPGV